MTDSDADTTQSNEHHEEITVEDLDDVFLDPERLRIGPPRWRDY